ncbi:MAG: DNA polymerase I [Kiritimatiellae bacterium]|nr:DNA polymerase I [Kiritimatiellia bacterium]
MKTLFVIDLMPFLYRGHFVFLNKPRLTYSGLNTSALLGFVNGVMAMLKEHTPSHAVLAMDPEGKTFRHESFPEYKARRQKMPEDLAANIPYAFEVSEALGIPVLRKEGYEADDVIGTLATRAQADGFDEIYVVTPDKDAAQLVTEKIKLFRPGRGTAPSEVFGVEQVKEHWGLVDPKQMIDYLALAGDASDNIPGIKGVGEKSAIQLLQKWGSVENMVAHAAEIPGKLGEKVRMGVEDVKMSKYLTTIRTDVPLDVNWDFCRLESPDPEKLSAVCMKYELYNLAKRFGIFLSPENVKSAEAANSAARQNEQFKTISSTPHDYRLVTTEAQARELAAILEAADRFAFDTETTGTDARTADLVGMSFATEPGKAWYVSVPQSSSGELDLFSVAACSSGAVEDFVRIFAKAFADPSKTLVAQNAKYDMTVLKRYGISFGATVHDTMLEHYVLDAASRHSMDAMAREYLAYVPIPIENLIGMKERGKLQKNMRDLAPETILDYAAEDADVTLRLEDAMRPAVKDAGLERVLEECEEPLVEVLAEMEKDGVNIDVRALRSYGVSLDREIQGLVKSIMAFGDPGMNVDSPKQIGELLFEKLKLDPTGVKRTTKGQWSTDEKNLQGIVGLHPVVFDILEYRACAKLKSTYVEKLPQCIDPADGRIHTTFAQALTETGRLSSSEPNLQNIPVRTERGKNIRSAIVPSDGDHLLVSADYSQIELRLMAAMSGDAAMKDAFARGEDIHRDTASRVFGVPASEVTAEQRSKCKMVNFGIIYGISAFGLAQRLKITRSEAAELIDTYFKLYPAVRRFMDDSIAKARETGYAVTMLGRRRSLRDIKSRNATARMAAERDAINTPVQGTAADLIKLAMVRVSRALKQAGLKAKMILQIHDELLFDAPKNEVEQVKEIAVREMTRAMDLDVPLEVSVGVGANWLEAH